MNCPIEIYQLVLSYADFLSQIRLRCVCKTFYERLEIHDFFDVDTKYLGLLSDKILRSYPFIIRLYANYNEKITNVNHLTKLEVLDASGFYCGISSHGISRLSLKELYVDGNPKITDLNHMTRLEILNVSRNSSINNMSIQKLNLMELIAANNENITNVNHMNKL